MKKISKINSRQFSLQVLWKEVVVQQLHHLAAFLQVQMATLSLARQKWVLITYLLIASFVSISVSYCSLFSADANRFTITPIKPALVYPHTTITPKITEKEYRRIHELRLYLDSIHDHRNGLKKGEPSSSFPSTRDTLLFLERLYLNQQNN